MSHQGRAPIPPHSAMASHYELLGVTRTAPDEEIKRAYRKLALEWHPDKNPSGSAKEVFQRLSEAAAVLLDPARRAEYDAALDGVPPART